MSRGVCLLSFLITYTVVFVEVPSYSINIRPNNTNIQLHFISIFKMTPESEYVGNTIPDDVLNEILTTDKDESVTLKGILNNLPAHYKGIALFLFPAVNTPHCTDQACKFGQSRKDLNDLGYEVYGLTSGQRSSPREWALKNGITYTLLLDKQWKIINYLDCKWLYFLVNRSHLIISRNSKILAFERGVNAATSSSRLLDLIKHLK